MYRNLLIPVDDTEQSYGAVGVAGLLAAASGARLTLFHVVRPAPVAVADMATQRGLVQVPRAEETRPLFGRCQQILADRGLRAEEKVATSRYVAEAILKEAKAGGYDGIVIGHRGRQDLKRLLLGSVANGVLVEAGCTTILVHVPEGSG